MQEKIIELDLKKFLGDFANTEVDFYRFPGNYGDSLIYHGTITLLGELSIKVNFVEIDSNIKNNVLLIDGGGNFIDEYNDVYNFLVKKHQKYKTIVILPHTVYGERQSNFLPSLGPNVTIFCREVFSYNFVIKHITEAKCYLWHDCAFYNNLITHVKIGKGVLNAFRVDVESNRKTIYVDNEDISYNGWCMKPLDDFLKKIEKHDEIRTDRLHVAIAATLLNKKVIFFSNSYYKNLAVYEYSLKKYPDVVFIYEKDVDLVSYNNIELLFKKYLISRLNKQEHTIHDLFKDLIKYNHTLWRYEDLARNVNSTDKKVRDSKQYIDKFNQLRNETIRKIDFNLFYILNNTEQTELEKYISESLGMFIDRLSIMFIRKHELKRLISVIDDISLLKIYKQKVVEITEQISFNGNYLDFLISDIKNKNKFFKIFNPVKIYNDSRIRKYINRPDS